MSTKTEDKPKAADWKSEFKLSKESLQTWKSYSGNESLLEWALINDHIQLSEFQKWQSKTFQVPTLKPSSTLQTFISKIKDYDGDWPKPSLTVGKHNGLDVVFCLEVKPHYDREKYLPIIANPTFFNDFKDLQTKKTQAGPEVPLAASTESLPAPPLKTQAPTEPQTLVTKEKADAEPTKKERNTLPHSELKSEENELKTQPSDLEDNDKTVLVKNTDELELKQTTDNNDTPAPKIEPENNLELASDSEGISKPDNESFSIDLETEEKTNIRGKDFENISFTKADPKTKKTKPKAGLKNKNTKKTLKSKKQKAHDIFVEPTQVTQIDKTKPAQDIEQNPLANDIVIEKQTPTWSKSWDITSINKDCPKYHGAMILEFKNEAFSPVHLTSDCSLNTEATNLLEPNTKPGIFHIISSTKKPYHGALAPIEKHKTFFNNWNLVKNDSLPETVTALPLIKAGQIIGCLLAYGDKTCNDWTQLEILEEYAHNQMEKLKLAKAS